MIGMVCALVAAAVIIGLTLCGLFDPHPGDRRKPRRQSARDADLINTPTAPVQLVQMRPTPDTITRLCARSTG